METFKTRDLYEAAFLYASEVKLLTLKAEGREFWFIFESKESGELSGEYWRGEGNIAPKKYSDAIRSLKDLIFSRKEKE